MINENNVVKLYSEIVIEKITQRIQELTDEMYQISNQMEDQRNFNMRTDKVWVSRARAALLFRSGLKSELKKSIRHRNTLMQDYLKSQPEQRKSKSLSLFPRKGMVVIKIAEYVSLRQCRKEKEILRDKLKELLGLDEYVRFAKSEIQPKLELVSDIAISELNNREKKQLDRGRND